MGVRRQVDADKDVISFKKLLKEISAVPQALSRNRVRKLYDGAGDFWFNKYVGKEMSYINSVDVNKEISTLDGKADAIRKYANKTIAHPTNKNIPTTFNELDQCLDYLENSGLNTMRCFVG